MLDEKITRTIYRIASDNQSGNHLTNLREDEYWYLRDIINEALQSPNPTPIQSEIIDCYNKAIQYAQDINKASQYVTEYITKRINEQIVNEMLKNERTKTVEEQIRLHKNSIYG